MSFEWNGFVFSTDKNLISIDRVAQLLSQTYWAENRSKALIETSIKKSICYGIYKDGYQVGFARVVTDYATIFWVGDVIIDPEYRRSGLGKKLVEYLLRTSELQGISGILATSDAHGLYEQYGFVKDAETFMRKKV